MSDRRIWSLIFAFVVAGLPTIASAEQRSHSSASKGTPLPELRGPTSEPAPFRIAIGPLSAWRSMTFEGNAETISHRPMPYLGGYLAVSGLLWHDDQLDAFLSTSLELGYGVGQNDTFNPTAGPAPTTELTTGTGKLYLDRRLGDHLLAGLGTGLAATSVTLQPNPLYTGHRYIAAEVSLRLRWLAVTDALDLGLEAGILPVFALDNSHDGHGEGTAFGARAEARIAWRPAPYATGRLRHLRLVARYRYQRFRSQFPVSFLGSRGAVSVDNQHIGLVMVEYAVGP